jgi:hypothetical protein
MPTQRNAQARTHSPVFSLREGEKQLVGGSVGRAPRKGGGARTKKNKKKLPFGLETAQNKKHTS